MNTYESTQCAAVNTAVCDIITAPHVCDHPEETLRRNAA